MCWNAEISLNTFLFSTFVLILIIYNNAYTKYKIKELNNVWMYIFIFSFVLMQLIEFFIWKNINNKYYNNVFSILATCLLIIQPVASIMILSNIELRNLLLVSYSLLAIPYSIYRVSTQYIHSSVGESGHLKWHFFDNNPIIYVIWMFFFLFSFIYENHWGGFIFVIVSLSICFINYKHNNAMWSMWCWLVNTFLIYYAIYLLIVLPFIEKGKIC